MSIMTREKFASFLEPYIYKVYEQTINQEEDIIPKLFDVQNTEKAEEKHIGIGTLGLMQEWNGTVYYDEPDPLWSKTYSVKKYSLGIRIERDLWEDAQYSQVKDRVNSVMLSIFRTRQLHATSVFDNAFTAGATAGPDTKALCASDHPTSPTDSTAQVNAGSSPLSIDSIEATRLAMMNYKDDRGKKMLIVPDTIIVPPALSMSLEEILKSAGRADTANRVDNVRQNAYKIVVLPLLGDANNWFMIDSKLMKQYLKWYERRKPVPEKDEDFDTELLKWKMVSRYSYGFHGWQWIYGHAVS